MNILIDHGCDHCVNLGDVAMLQTSAARIKALWPAANIHIMTSNAARLELFCPGTHPVDATGRRLYSRPGALFGPLSRKISRVERRILVTQPAWSLRILQANDRHRKIGWSHAAAYVDAIRQSNLVVASGGGYLTDAFAHVVEGMYTTLLLAKKFGKPFALLGQGLGPLSDPRLREMTRNILASADFIALREGLKGPALTASWGLDVDRVMVTGDDAIEMAYHRRKAEIGDSIGISIRTAKYAAVGDLTVIQLRAALNTLRQMLNVDFVPLPVSFDAGGEDVNSIRSLVSSDQYETNGGAAIDSPAQLIDQIGRCRVVFAGSYHAAVFALSQGIPVIAGASSVYIADKFAGLANLFPGGCVVINMNRPDFEGALVGEAIRLWQCAPDVRAGLLMRAQAQISDGLLAYQQLFRLAS